MKTLIIYFTEDKKSFQVIKPTATFNQDYKGLADHITKSNEHDGKKYHSYELI